MSRTIVRKIAAWAILSFCILAGNFSYSSASHNLAIHRTTSSMPAKFHGKSGDFDSKTPITVRLSMTNLPKLGEETEFICKVSSVVDAFGTTASIVLPEDIVVVSGVTRWEGNLYANQPVLFSATIAFQTVGRKMVRASANRMIDGENSWGDMDAIYLNIGTSRSVEGIYLPEEKATMNQADAAPGFPPQVGQPSASSEALRVQQEIGGPPSVSLPGRAYGNNPSQETTPQGALTVTGSWSHYDRGGSLIGSKVFLVELRRASDGAHLAFSYTDNNGNFSLGPVTNPGSAGVKVRIWTYVKYTSSDPTGDELMVVLNGRTSDYSNTYFSETSTTFVFPDGTSSVGGWQVTRDNPEGSHPNAHAWYIKDDLNRGYIYPPTASGDCTVEWQFDSTVGTYYQSGGHVHLMGVDRRAPDVIIHEMGHNVMYNIYGHTFPSTDCPNPHYIELSSGIVCAWTEGWADFYALVVNGDPTFTWPAGNSLNLETPTWGTSGWDNGATVEGRVAGALWDIFDSANDGDDHLFDGFSRIWSTASTHFDSTFRNYWDDFILTGISTTAASDAVYQNTIDYRPIPTLTTSITLNPPGPSYAVGQTISGTFSIQNRGTSPITIDALTIGGRLNDDNTVRDFPWHRTITLNPNQTATYQDSFTFTEAGNYRFFPAYRTLEGTWKIGLLHEIPRDPGVVDLVNVTASPSCNAPGSFSLISPTNGQSLSPTTSTTLSWGSSANANSYDVYFGTSSNPPFLANQTGTTRSVNVSPGSTYFWKIVARVNCNSSLTFTTGIWSFSVQQNCNAPGSFSLISPTNGQSLSPTASTTLSWGTSANSDSYDVYFGTSSNPPFLANQTGTTRSVSVSPGSTYFWKIVSRVNCNSSLTFTTGIWSFSVQQTCNTPGSFSLSSPTNGQSISPTTSTNLSWGTSANADSYDVYFGTSSNPPFIANQTGTSRSVSVTQGQTYFWQVVARVNCNSSLTFTTPIWSFFVQSGGTLPDLVVTSFTASTTGTPGAQIMGATNIANQGSSNAGAFRLGFYFSTDNIITTADTFTGWVCQYPAGLGAGQSTSCTGQIGVPPSLPPGTYYVGAIVDDQGLIPESNEANNSRAADTGPVALKTPFDFDGDGKSDVSVFRPSTGTWFIINSSNGSSTITGWGQNGDKPVAGDYDGDGKTDIAIWRPSTGVWWIRNSSNGSTTMVGWGVSSDVPAPADYDGDGKTDLAVWRPATGTWFIINSSNGLATSQVWGTSGDKVAPADYDGDGKADLAVFRPATGTWFIINSANGSTTNTGWGQSGDIPVAADFDGDGKTDIAIWRPSTGVWWIRKSSDGSTSMVGWGVSTDVPVPADYDGDGKSDNSVWRTAGGFWLIINSSNGSTTTVVWGSNGDIPVSARS